MAEKQQHVDIQRKLKLRKTLLEKADSLPGAYYIPYIGEGDIAVALYNSKKVYGADIDPAMVETAKSRLPDAHIITADCDTYPFNEVKETFVLADFDAYSYPYNSFRSFWKGAKIGSQCVLFFTDGQRQSIHRSLTYKNPDGEKITFKNTAEMRPAYNFYFNKIVLPWFKEYIKPWTIVYITKYLRKNSMCYWGAIIENPGEGHIEYIDHIEKLDKGVESKPYKFDTIKKEEYLENLRCGHTRGYAATLVGVSRVTVYDHMKKDKGFADAISEAEGDAIAKIENALFEAANSGNVTAIQVFLYNRDPKRWADRRNIQLAGKDGGPIEVEIDAKGKLVSILSRLAQRAKEGETHAS